MSKLEQYVILPHLRFLFRAQSWLSSVPTGWGVPRYDLGLSIFGSNHQRSPSYVLARSQVWFRVGFSLFPDVLRHLLSSRLERECTKDITYNGIHMKKGMLVSVATYPLHYSEEYYSEPQKFDPDRSATLILCLQLRIFLSSWLERGISIGGRRRTSTRSTHTLMLLSDWVHATASACDSPWKNWKSPCAPSSVKWNSCRPKKRRWATSTIPLITSKTRTFRFLALKDKLTFDKGLVFVVQTLNAIVGVELRWSMERRRAFYGLSAATKLAFFPSHIGFNYFKFLWIDSKLIIKIYSKKLKFLISVSF